MPDQTYWNRDRRRAVSRRSALKSAAAVGGGLAALTLAACAGDSTSRTTSSPGSGTAQPKRGGLLTRLTAADGSFNQGIDPHKTGGSEAGLMGFWYQSVLRTHPVTNEVEAELAQKWEQPSPTEYILSIAQNVTWHNKPPVNGRALTTEDIAFALNRARTNDPLFVNRSLFNQIDKIEARDKTTVRVTTKVPDVTTLLNLGDLTMLILAPEVISRWDKLTSAEHGVGTGAFILQNLDETGADLVRNPNYWKSGLPYMDNVRMAHIAEQQTAFSAFLANQLDIVQVPGEQSKKFLAERGNQYFTGWSPGVNCFLVTVNTAVKPFDDARIQRAIRLMMDHQEGVTAWAEVYFGAGSSYTLPHAMDSWDLTQQEYASLLEWKQPKTEAAAEAVRLLSAAGYSSSNPLQFKLMNSNTPQTGRATSEIAQAQYHKHSGGAVRVELQLVDNASSRTLQTRGEFDVSGPVARGSFYDPDQFLTQNYHSKGSSNFSKWGDPKLDEMIDRQRTIFDPAPRKALVRDIVKYIIENAPITNLASRDILNATQLRVKEFLPEPGRWPGWQYERIWLDT
jgi:peptide/nickel transport system substrate-binding protein